MRQHLWADIFFLFNNSISQSGRRSLNGCIVPGREDPVAGDYVPVGMPLGRSRNVLWNNSLIMRNCNCEMVACTDHGKVRMNLDLVKEMSRYYLGRIQRLEETLRRHYGDRKEASCTINLSLGIRPEFHGVKEPHQRRKCLHLRKWPPLGRHQWRLPALLSVQRAVHRNVLQDQESGQGRQLTWSHSHPKRSGKRVSLRNRLPEGLEKWIRYFIYWPPYRDNLRKSLNLWQNKLPQWKSWQ